MDEDLENRAIETLPVVSSVCFHTGGVPSSCRVNIPLHLTPYVDWTDRVTRNS
jgi:hypothetical protein